VKIRYSGSLSCLEEILNRGGAEKESANYLLKTRETKMGANQEIKRTGVPPRLSMKSPVLEQLHERSLRLKGAALPHNNAIDPIAGGRHGACLRKPRAGFTLRARTFRSGRSGPSSRLIAMLYGRWKIGIRIILAVSATSFFVACASMSKGYIYQTDEEAVGDSTYVYGYAVVGRHSRFQMVFENTATKEKKTYLKQWGGNGIYKEHIFAFSIPAGSWKFSEIKSEEENLGVVYNPKKVIVLKNGFGNFIGKIDTQNYPLNESQFESVQVIRDKEKVDLMMKERFSRFNVDKTFPIEYKLID
jgi:hypothetical protein